MPVVLDFDQMYFRTQRLVSRCCRLLVFWDVIQTACLLSVNGRHDSKSHSNVFTEVFTPWGKDTLELSEEIFVSLLDLLESERNLRQDADANNNISPSVSASSIYTAPDHLFNLLEVAGIFLVAFKFLIYRIGRVSLLHSSDVLLERVIEHFRKLEAPREHPATKCADLLAGLLALWRDRENVMAPQAAWGGEFQNGQVGGYQVDESMSSNRSPRTTIATTSPPAPGSFNLHPNEISTGGTLDVLPQSGVDIGISLAVPPMPTFDVDVSAPSNGDIDIDAWFNSAVLQDDQFWQNIFMQQGKGP